MVCKLGVPACCLIMSPCIVWVRVMCRIVNCVYQSIFANFMYHPWYVNFALRVLFNHVPISWVEVMCLVFVRLLYHPVFVNCLYHPCVVNCVSPRLV